MALALIIPVVILIIIIIIVVIIGFKNQNSTPDNPKLWACESCDGNDPFLCRNCHITSNDQAKELMLSTSSDVSDIQKDIILGNIAAYNAFIKSSEGFMNANPDEPDSFDDYVSGIIKGAVVECYEDYALSSVSLSEFDTRNPTWTSDTPASAKWPSPKYQEPDSKHKNIVHNNAYPDGVIMGSLNQGGCGSCWVFSSVTAISDRYRIENSRGRIKNIGGLQRKIWYLTDATGGMNTITTVSRVNPNNSSYTEVLNCISPYEVGSCAISTSRSISNYKDPTEAQICAKGNVTTVCSGGFPESVAQYFRTVGANLTLRDIPLNNPGVTRNNVNSASYLQMKYSCQGCNPGRFNVCDYITFNSTSDIINKYKIELYANGPFVVAFMVYQTFMDLKKDTTNGLYMYSITNTSNLGRNLGGHAVTIIGWTTINRELYWIIRNSWGNGWGNNGCFFINSVTAGIVDMYNLNAGIIAPLITCPTSKKCNTTSQYPSKYKGQSVGYAQCNNCDIFTVK